MSTSLFTAVVMIIFNRPEQTGRVFQAVAEAKPSRLYIIADGPRSPEESLLCQQTRKVVEKVDWDCDVRKNYSDVNLGLRNRVISGLDWVFEQEETAIILEDDCLPHPTFFSFCDELLNYYKDDSSVMHISGDNFLMGKVNIPQSYYFSKYSHIWGWATWRRAWSLFHTWDDDFSKMKVDLQVFSTSSERRFWKGLVEQLRFHRMNYTWDYQWALACLAHKGLCVMPAHNLVSNIGFGAAATHTHEDSWLANMPVSPMLFPLQHPAQKVWNRDADAYSANIFFGAKSASWRDHVRTNLRQLVKMAKKKYYEM